jgi:hypothetical protein
MLRDCPHMGEKVKTVHNVHQYETVEDMGINVPRIYATLDNKQVEYQSHMIEVEGMINNHKRNFNIAVEEMLQKRMSSICKSYGRDT